VWKSNHQAVLITRKLLILGSPRTSKKRRISRVRQMYGRRNSQGDTKRSGAAFDLANDLQHNLTADFRQRRSVPRKMEQDAPAISCIIELKERCSILQSII